VSPRNPKVLRGGTLSATDFLYERIFISSSQTQVRVICFLAYSKRSRFTPAFRHDKRFEQYIMYFWSVLTPCDTWNISTDSVGKNRQH